ncbi:MAG: transglutaminase family protein, partial [Rhodopirellula sp. JB055]
MFWLASLAAALIAGGCDLPDRYDIQTFEKPSPWDTETSTSFASQARNTARPSSAADALLQTGAPDSRAPGQTPSNSLARFWGNPAAHPPAADTRTRLADEWET